VQGIPVLVILILLCACCASVSAADGMAVGKIQTVQGPIDPEELGRTLTHEHVLVDFIGADKVSPDRYDADEVFRVMLPYLKDVKAAGIDSLFECSPNYLGRDPALLRRLSIASGLHIVTNTGLYKEPYLPQWALDASVQEIARKWIQEATEGIGPERIKPGFIKIAAHKGDLGEVQQKIVRAAALTSKATGLTIACHTGFSPTALQELDILRQEGVPGSRLVFVHAQSDGDIEGHTEVAERGAWVSYDGIRENKADTLLPLVLEGLKRWPDQVLISQDAGWYHVGEPGGGTVVAIDWLPRSFIPMLTTAGVTQAEIDKLLVTNPARAFTIRPPITE
jgi:predicted metal-dependent phosphotriesterase family hydrolase